MITFLLCRQVNAAGKDASEDDIEKIELECVRIFTVCNLAWCW